VRGYRLAIFLFSLASVVWASRISPRDGFFSVEAPEGWDLTQSANIFIWASKDTHASINANLLNEQLTFAQVNETIKSRGFQKTTEDDRTFHGFPCFYAEGYSSSLDQKAVIYYCRVRRDNQHWSVFFSTLSVQHTREHTLPCLVNFSIILRGTLMLEMIVDL
jgi:hypothetical protein